MNAELTELQERFLLLIYDHIRRHGKSPTRRELAKVSGQKSTHGVNQILNALNKKGYITIGPARATRNIVVRHVPARQLPLTKVGP